MQPFEESSRVEGAPRQSSAWVLTAVVVALLVSIVLNVLLAHKVQSVTAARTARISDRLPKVGTSVPAIAAKRLGAGETLIVFHDSVEATVLYVFTPSCVWCARNLDNLKTLVGQESTQYRVIGLSLSEEGLAEYVGKNDLKLPIYSGLSAEILKAYKLGSTPQTIVVSPEGKVLQNWVGAYVGEQKSQIEAFFHVKLPGLRDLTTTTSEAKAPSGVQ